MSVPAIPTRFVLVGTSHPGNVGAAARAMAVMGFDDLVLVAPRRPIALDDPDAVAFASGATALLRSVRTLATLDEALDGITTVLATAMTPRDFGPPTLAPRVALSSLAQRLGPQGGSVAFVFGSERHGLANDDVWRSHLCLSIPTSPAYGSLNLAQAVQILAYEWREALGGHAVQTARAPARHADAAAVSGVVEHWRRALVAVEFLDPAVPRRLLPRLQQLANRLELQREEVDILRGIAAAVLRIAARTGDRTR